MNWPDFQRRAHRASVLGLLLAAGWFAEVSGHAEAGYQKAPAPIGDLLATPAAPSVIFNSQRDALLIYRAERHPPVADLAEPVLRLAGVRLNPANNGPHRSARCVELTLRPLPEGKDRPVTLPANARISVPIWAPDGKQFAFVRYGSREVELWVGESKRGSVRKLRGGLNATLAEPFTWMPDSQTLICTTVPANRPKPPADTHLADGPVVQEANGKPSPARTFQDLLETPHDEALFEYYATAQLMLVSTKSAESKPLGAPGIYVSAEPAPNGQLFLLARLVRPFSYQLPASMFPRVVEVVGLDGKVAFELARLPLAEEVPIGGVRPGPRNYHWRPTSGAMLVWVEALDGGDSRKKVPHRDRLLMLESPFVGQPIELEKLEKKRNMCCY